MQYIKYIIENDLKNAIFEHIYKACFEVLYSFRITLNGIMKDCCKFV